MYKNILVPIILDGAHDTAASFNAARALAGPEAAFTVLHVLEAIPSYARTEVPGNVLAAKQQEIAHELAEAAKATTGIIVENILRRMTLILLQFPRFPA